MSNEKQRSEFTKAIGIVLILVGALLTFVGGSAVLHFTFDFIGFITLLLALVGLLLLISGIIQLFASRSIQSIQQQLATNLDTAAEATPETLLNQPVRAHWFIDTETWNLFEKNEIKYRNEDNVYFFIAFFVAGTIMVVLMRNASISVALLTTGIIGAIVVYIRRRLALAKLKPGNSKKEVFITDYFVVMNGEQYYLQNEHRFTSKVTLYENTSPAILEFTIYWQTRKGITFDELRIPVPPIALKEAKQISINFIPPKSIQ